MPAISAFATCSSRARPPFDYLYDFGDSWELRLIVTHLRQGDPALEYPRYIGGERNAPPEDCGGIPGFYAMLDAVADPANPDHADASEWLEGYDPEAVDEVAVKYALSRIARRRNAAAARIKEKIRPAQLTLTNYPIRFEEERLPRTNLRRPRRNRLAGESSARTRRRAQQQSLSERPLTARIERLKKLHFAARQQRDWEHHPGRGAGCR